MTAEIVLMNREAVALAADSAGTVGGKTYPTANKLFTLSKVFPVGIMISNASDFMGVPWETVIKMYREEKLGQNEKPTIRDYCMDFLSSIVRPKFCPVEEQKLRITQIVSDHLTNVANEAQGLWATKLVQDGRCSNREKGLIIKNSLAKYRDHLAGFSDAVFNDLTSTKLVRGYRDALEQGIDQGLSEFELTQSARSVAFQCAKLAILKDVASSISSTIAIAGFGGEEVFPSSEIVEIDGVIGNEIKITEWNSRDIDRSGHISVVWPLAQGEMVHRFMRGVDDIYQTAIDNYFEDFCLSIGMNQAQASQVLKKFQGDMDDFKKKKFSDPIARTLVHLSKTDMAKMAESLVSLTSLKRKVSEELETVADPIDVAVISKGDGFIWIKRKHYFSSELNPHYARQYLRGLQ